MAIRVLKPAYAIILQGKSRQNPTGNVIELYVYKIEWIKGSQININEIFIIRHAVVSPCCNLKTSMALCYLLVAFN